MNKEIIPTYNTYIGGVSASITSASSLATVLGISSSIIEDFTIDGSDIKCNITSSYVIAIGAFAANSAITYYIDKGVCTDIRNAFQFAPNITYLEFPNVSIVKTGAVASNPKLTDFLFKNATSCETTSMSPSLNQRIYVPNITDFGGSPTYNTVFWYISSWANVKLYVNPVLATNNSGAEDGDVAYARTNGAIIRYVTNFTNPLTPTITSVGTTYNTAIQLIDPGTSTNAIDYYEVSVNGGATVIVNVGNYITGLTQNTAYNITIKAVDIFFNKSDVSSVISVSTANNSTDISVGLVSYYKLQSNSNDSFGSVNNGADANATYVTGKIGNAVSYSGSSSGTSIGNPTNLQLVDLSISCWIKTSAPGGGDKGLIFKTGAYNIFFYGNNLATYSYGSPSGYKSTGVSVADGNWKHIVITQQSGVTNGTKIYINGTLVLTTTVGQTTQGNALEFGRISGGNSANFILDEVGIYNTILTQTDVDNLYNSGSGITL